MKQTVGFGVLLAVALAAMRGIGGGGAASSPSTDTEASGARVQFSARAEKAAKRRAAPSAYQHGCTVFDPDTPDPSKPAAYPRSPEDANRGAAKSVVDHFFDQQGDTASLKTRPGIHYALALAPDPRHTNLSLLFDREMVAIQQAAQDEGYTYNSSWLPWKTEAATFSSVADQQRTDEAIDQLEACPGILLFRRSVNDPTDTASPFDQGLVVLVVGEQPTGGINPDQWLNAIAWLNANASPRTEAAEQPELPPQAPTPKQPAQAPDRILTILGPTFSGSFVSLERNLSTLRTGKSAPGVFPHAATEVRILSGSVSSCSSSLWFQNSIRQQKPGTTVFGSFQENDELQIDRLLNYLDQQGTSTSDIAILSEDETAYANTYVHKPETGKAKNTETGKEKTGSGNKPDSPLAIPPCEFPYADQGRPVRFSYPRDISALRSAYKKQSVFSTSSSGRAIHPILQESAALEGEPTTASDTIAAYGGPIIPVAQEAVLYGLVSHLRTHHTRYLILRSTNPLDFLFLTRFFHRAYPEARIVTVGSDLLFGREIDTTEFRGVFALSNYPLLPRNQHWSALSTRDKHHLTDPPGPNDPAAPYIAHTHRIPESHMEGTYLAGRYLFHENEWHEPEPWPQPVSPGAMPTALTLPFEASLPDFADPFWMHAPTDTLEMIQPPTWLTVVGRDGYWPIAVLNNASTPDQQLDLDPAHRSQTKLNPKKPKKVKPTPPPTLVRIQPTETFPNQPPQPAHYGLNPANTARFDPSLPFKLPLAWGICAACATMLLLYQLFGVVRGHRFTATGLFSLFRRVATPSQSILLGIHSALAAALLQHLLAVGPALFDQQDASGSTFELVLFAALWLAGSITLFVFLLRSRPGQPLLVALAFLSILAVSIAVCIPAFWIGLDNDNRIPFFYRMGHLTSGVSPLVPVLFLLAGLYLWTWQALAGNSLLCCGRPILPRLVQSSKPRATHPLQYWSWSWYCTLLGTATTLAEPNPAFLLERSFYRISHEIDKSIIRVASPLCVDPSIILLPLLLGISALFFFLKDLLLHGMESHAYSTCINIALLFAFLLTIAEAGRLFLTWMQLRRLLGGLNRLRLRRTFSRLRAVDESSIWSVSGSVQRIQYLFFSQQLDAANRLIRLPGIVSPILLTAVACGARFAENSAPELNQGPLWEKPVLPKGTLPRLYIRELMNNAVADVLNTILIPYWATEPDSLSLDASPTKSAEPDSDHRCFDLPLCQDPRIATAEEFVCFHYIAFIQNVLARMRTMTLSMVCLFVSVCFAISFYPFAPRTGIGTWMLVNLLFIAAAVVYVYAGMERDEILSYITNTTPGRLSTEFYLKTASFLAGPVLGLLTTQFPAISESFLGLVQPGLDALK